MMNSIEFATAAAALFDPRTPGDAGMLRRVVASLGPSPGADRLDERSTASRGGCPPDS